MFEQIFCSPRTLSRLSKCPFTEGLRAFGCYLQERTYSRRTIRHYLRDAEHFLRWIAVKKMALHCVNEDVVGSFARYEAKRRYRHRVVGKTIYVRPGLWHFLKMLRSRGDANVADHQPGTIGDILSDYDRYLDETCGFTVDTRISRARFAREFLRATFGDKKIRWDQLQAKHFRSFVCSFGRSGLIASAVVAASTLRGFLRWLVSQGRCSADLIPKVPRIHRCKHSSLTRVLTDQQLKKFLAAFDRSTAVGRRNYAMALCQVHLGLRVGEVAALTIDDIDWRNATIQIAAGKTRRGRKLPLLASVGRAIADYLLRGRPTTDDRHLFVRDYFPVGRQLSISIIINVYRRAFAEVPGCESWCGSHPLRHTAATRMYRGGANLKSIADMLGHLSLDTTTLYTRVDFVGLAAVALPWPKGAKQ
jgi:integrase/recombinase XerD